MNLILDAHIVIWSVIPNLMLSHTISDLINAQKEPVGFSIAQFWEVEIKIAARRLQGLDDLSEIVRNLNLELVPIEPSDAIRAAHLPRHHGDPFDRMLIAQAQSRGLTIVTHDKIFGSYAVPVIWA
jgi:PIN domain nuclease of toxin-antitoxin system